MAQIECSGAKARISAPAWLSCDATTIGNGPLPATTAR